MATSYIAIKCLVVGNHAIGKSSLIKTYIDGDFPPSVESAVLDSFHCDIPIEQTTYKIEIIDVPGEREEFNDIRNLAYKQADACILCFSLDDRESLEAVKRKWATEVKNAVPSV
jgi:small GTP-binding protein